MWKHAQWQSNKDGRPRIPLQPDVSEAPDIESQASLRRGVATEQHQQSRNQKQYQEWERNRSCTRLTNRSKVSDKWEEVPYSQRKKFAKLSQSQPIRLEQRYDILRVESELDKLWSYGTMQCSQPDTNTHPGMYKSRKSSNGSVVNRQRHEEARGKLNRGGKGRLKRGGESERHEERESGTE